MSNDEEEKPRGEPLGTDYAGRKIWLVKVCMANYFLLAILP